MLDVEHMKLVFRLGGSGISLPVDHLVEIVQVAGGGLDRGEIEVERGLLGHVDLRGVRLPVYALNDRLGLPPAEDPEMLTLLVLSGRQGPWGLQADAVDGIFPANGFRFLPLPELLQPSLGRLYPGLDLWQNELLLAGDAGAWAEDDDR